MGSAQQACAVRTPLTLQLEVPRSLLPEAFPFFAQEERYDDVAAWSEALQRSVQRALSRTAECHDVRLQVSVEGSQSPSSKSAGGPRECTLQQKTSQLLMPAAVYRVSLASDAALAIDAPSSGGHGISLLSEHLSEQLAALFQLAPSSAVHSLREIPYAMRIRTVWHLLNEDAAQQSPLPAGLAAWDARALDEALDRHVGPIARALRGTHRIGRESQSHWWAPLAFEPELRKRQVAEAQAHDVYAEPASEAGSSEAATADSEASEPVEADDAASTADTPLYEPQNDSDEHAERVRQAVEEAQFARDGQEDSPLDDEEQAKEEEAVEELLAAVEQPDEASATAADASASETGLALPELPAEPATEDVHVITPEQLQVFVNSAEWSLSSPSPATAWEFPSAPWLSDPEREAGLALRRLAWGDEESDTERTLHFCVFVPSPKHRPLYIDEATSESARGFLVPQWGGVVLYNPPAPEDASSSRNSSSLLPPFAAAELDDMMPLFASQLRSLLGLRLPRSPAGSTEAQRLARRAVALDALLRRRIAETANEAVDTLHGIIRLVHKITNLGVGKQVQDDVRDALEALDMVRLVLNCATTTY
jgi:hypothetical protein